MDLDPYDFNAAELDEARTEAAESALDLLTSAYEPTSSVSSQPDNAPDQG